MFQLFALISCLSCVAFGNERIIGGSAANIEDFPYFVSVFNKKYLILPDDNICGGTLIKENVVLTAAHCCQRGLNSFGMSVRAGTDRNNDTDNKITVKEIILHPKFDSKTVNYDFCLLKLWKPFTLSEKIKLVDLAEEGNRPSYWHKKAVTVGFGITSDILKWTPNVLKSVDVPIITEKTCSAQKWPLKITEAMICTQSLFGNFCHGDSGGPLIVDGKQIGVVSWFRWKCSPPLSGIYAFVPAAIDWIKKNM